MAENGATGLTGSHYLAGDASYAGVAGDSYVALSFVQSGLSNGETKQTPSRAADSLSAKDPQDHGRLDLGGYRPPATSTLSPPVVNASAPVIGNFSPTVGSEVARTGTIAFDVTDDQGAFRRIIVIVSYPETGDVDVVHDGVAFRGAYQASSTRVAIAGGFRYTVARTGGWRGAPTFEPIAIDTSGNEGT